jgi:hypothetical protein
MRTPPTPRLGAVQLLCSDTHSGRIDQAARALLALAVADAPSIGRRRYVLTAAHALDHTAVVRAAAARLCCLIPIATIADAERALWYDARRLLDWRDLRELEPWGRA